MNSPKHTYDSGDATPPAEVYRKPRFRKIELAAEEVLTTGCKQASVCDVLPASLGGQGAGS